MKLGSLLRHHLGFALVLQVTLAFFSVSVTSAGSLTQLSSNAGEIRSLLKTSSTTLFAGTQGGGLYKSTDSGSTWTKLSGFGERYVWRLAGHTSNSQLVLAATSRGLLKSTDGGSTWTQLTYDSVRAVAVDPFDTNHVLIGVPGAGIFSSFDGGTSSP